MRRAHNVKVGERTTELIKMNVGSALTETGESARGSYIVHGPNMMTALPMGSSSKLPGNFSLYRKIHSKIETSACWVRRAGSSGCMPISCAMASILRVAALCFGGLDERLTDKIGIQFPYSEEDPLLAVRRALGRAGIDKFSFPHTLADTDGTDIPYHPSITATPLVGQPVYQ